MPSQAQGSGAHEEQPACHRNPISMGPSAGDDGDRPPTSFDGGRGIAGMRERVTLYAGELTVGVRPAGGFGVRARFPIEDT